MPPVRGTIVKVQRNPGQLCFDWRINRFLSQIHLDYFQSPDISFDDSSWLMEVHPNSQWFDLRLIRCNPFSPGTMKIAFRLRGSRGHKKEWKGEFSKCVDWVRVWNRDCAPKMKELESSLSQGALVLHCEMTTDAGDVSIQTDRDFGQAEAIAEESNSSDKRDASIQTDGDFGQAEAIGEESNSSEKRASGDDEVTEENNTDGEEGESGNEEVERQIRVKSTPKIALPARHNGVICSLKSVLASGSLSDFTLKSGGDKKWAVHRALLEGRSGHLDALLQGANELRLDDVTDDAMGGLVRFLYAGEVGNVNDILAAAHELNLGDLESPCIDCMEEWMCPELVCAALVTARAQGKGDLRARAMDCYFRDPGRVHATEGWKDLKENHTEIVADLFQEFVKREGKRRQD